ncbi:GFA family protein [Pendulispora brunnea]
MHLGSCLCRAVRYEIDGSLRRSSHCHCSMCRKFHGAACGTYTSMKRERLRIVAGADAITAYASSEHVRRSFCSRCGSSLFFEDDKTPEVIDVTLGTLDDEPEVKPAVHIFFADKAAWEDVPDDGLPRFEQSYPRETPPKT